MCIYKIQFVVKKLKIGTAAAYIVSFYFYVLYFYLTLRILIFFILLTLCASESIRIYNINNANVMRLMMKFFVITILVITIINLY